MAKLDSMQKVMTQVAIQVVTAAVMAPKEADTTPHHFPIWPMLERHTDLDMAHQPETCSI